MYCSLEPRARVVADEKEKSTISSFRLILSTFRHPAVRVCMGSAMPLRRVLLRCIRRGIRVCQQLRGEDVAHVRTHIRLNCRTEGLTLSSRRALRLRCER